MRRANSVFRLSVFLLLATFMPARPTPAAKATIRSLVMSGNLADLRWPNFSDHRTSADSFYKPSYQAAWIRNGAPSPQALAVIDVFQHADQEGLNAEDYDGSRWPDRIKTLQANHSAEDEARFDIALTVCAMRYVSDVRVGR